MSLETLNFSVHIKHALINIVNMKHFKDDNFSQYYLYNYKFVRSSMLQLLIP